MTNLLPIRKKKNIARIYQLRLASTTLWMFSSVLVIGLVLTVPALFLIESEKKDLSDQLGGVVDDSGSTDSESDDAVLKTTQEQLSVLTDGVGAYQTASYIHEVILGYRTENISLTRFSYDTLSAVGETVGKITLQGIARDRQSLEDFVDNLSEDPLFMNIEDPISNYKNDVNLPFSLVINIVAYEL